LRGGRSPSKEKKGKRKGGRVGKKEGNLSLPMVPAKKGFPSGLVLGGKKKKKERNARFTGGGGRRKILTRFEKKPSRSREKGGKKSHMKLALKEKIGGRLLPPEKRGGAAKEKGKKGKKGSWQVKKGTGCIVRSVVGERKGKRRSWEKREKSEKEQAKEYLVRFFRPKKGGGERPGQIIGKRKRWNDYQRRRCLVLKPVRGKRKAKILVSGEGRRKWNRKPNARPVGGLNFFLQKKKKKKRGKKGRVPRPKN